MNATDGRRVLVAGIGNVFLGDDGFGVEVVNRIDRAALPERVDVADYGIRGIHLAYDLLEGRHHTLIMVDAVPLEGPPGTLAVLEADPDDGPGLPAMDGHGMNPQAVLHLLHTLGGRVDRVLIVGCRPADVTERMGLTGRVAAAVPRAVRLVTELAADAARQTGLPPAAPAQSHQAEGSPTEAEYASA
ncbi:hydrogenase maturation protease [Thermomonospora curvata]|uniref:Hydrogenase maturation protease n=1 Tax=Thermomonospora curvata (strain ATCC 19995 / DSM 43183 / JCM 3096 / KCTC 9072 / NBRC 15933 / NCIMB 10081 / Henssen B9) TaxID=471852 RepID=D1A620_THECD|nr:hydrogenase maturation protease [Thermomonospora curvata]ACZ00119.1 hydrogenase maturation protease [Thermomonospora curvata DSM 43183]